MQHMKNIDGLAVRAGLHRDLGRLTACGSGSDHCRGAPWNATVLSLYPGGPFTTHECRRGCIDAGGPRGDPRHDGMASCARSSRVNPGLRLYRS